jgi:hypothetical protein
MKGIFAVTLFFLAACTARTPVLRADGSYMVSARVPLSGQSGAKSKAIEQGVADSLTQQALAETDKAT